ncbi:hypothetical protein [Methanobacterium sp. SMA-27]|uniref:hypothetical protein n=1 Tax=Methanobacterium sp. SMA-27 TaxID=1495336 RepID=UPI00064F9BB3|nr:hypothetical protein [Methanobacterium sp. SMA-27]
MEELKIKFEEELNYCPPVLGHLSSIGENEFSYRYYKFRHPAGIFSLQLNNIIDDFLDLLSSLEQMQNKKINVDERNINKKFVRLISSFFKYYESCYEIFVGCCKQHDPPRESEPLHQWLYKNNYDVGQKFFDKVKDDTGYFRTLNNKLKHTSNDLRIFCFYNNHMKIMGYYLESVDDNGSLGPDEELHPRFQDQHTANSFNFILRQLYYCIYEIANILDSVLIQHFREVYSINLSYNSEFTKLLDCNTLRNLNEKINNLPEFYFPNEFNREIPIPYLDDGYLIFEIEDSISLDLIGFKVGFVTSGDGFSRSFRLPFLIMRE